LLDKGRILAVSKCDMLDEELMQELKATIDLDIPVVFISAQAQSGIQELKDIIWKEIHR
jgi:GTPase